MRKILALTLALLMLVSVVPMSVFAASFDVSVSDNYFNVISKNEYNLAPGATETELVLNNAAGNDRKVAHIFEVDTKNESIEVLPGYYGIENLDPDNLALDGVADKSQYWKAEQLTKTVAYYEGLGYNVVGAMNTALAYDSNAPYGYMVYNGVVLGSPEVHKGAQTYLAIDAEGDCELRSMSTPLDGSEVTAISANFGWLVKDGVLTTKTVERTTSDASRSMIGIKEDGTLVFCQVDGRNDPFSSGLSNYEMGEMMLSIGCVNAVNCDGGGSSTFVSKREGENANVMRSVPSDGSERATINSVILVSKAQATGEFDHAVLSSDYDYYAPGTQATINVKGVDASGAPAEIPAEGISWKLADDSFGTVANGVFTSNGTEGDVTVQMVYGDKVVGERTIHVVTPDVFALSLDETVLPYGKSMTLDFACTYGADDWGVCVDGAYTISTSNDEAVTIEGNKITATTDETVSGVNVTVTYKPDPTIKDTLVVNFGKGSEIIYDFEDGTNAGFVGFDEAKQWCLDNGVNNTLVGSSPLDGQYNDQVDSYTTISDAKKGEPVRNGNHALAWKVDNRYADFASWTYNVIFNVGETIVLRDVANGKNATTLGMWLYIPEGAAGLAFQSQLYTKSGDSYTHCQSHFTFKTKNGTVKNLNSCTEADIPESRWVYASISLTAYDYVCTPMASFEGNVRTPSFIRTYIKPTAPAVHTFYIDDITLDYSSAVDDRVAPVISDVSYTTADESVALADGANINGNKIAFSATVSDNAKLDYSTGKILIDGNELENVTSSGKYLASESVALPSGAHTVAFEIKDALGNPTKIEKNFTVAGDSVITLAGHNDSNALPETDSIYYVDVNVADITNINKLTTVLNLQTANSWEYEGAVVADGFDAKFDFNETTDLLTVSVERNGEAVDEKAETLVSIPVRLWSWDTYSHVTGEVVTPETHFKTGYCPVVTLDCEVETGTVEFVKSTGYLGVFGGSISEKTNINDDVNPWHYHDAELKTLESKATCTADGYTGRTYCETCKSVVDWGKTTEATGHNFSKDTGKCTECGTQNTFTGLKEEDGKWYYLVNGSAVAGWQMIGTDWYYFDATTKVGADGDVKIGTITYNFKDGKLTSGVWAKTLYGYKYYYGPSCYERGWQTIDGKDYYFENFYRVEGGYQSVFENNINANWYYFEEDGSCDRTKAVPDGFYTDRNGYGYSKDGHGLEGLQKIDGIYYWFDRYGYARKGKISEFTFGDDYKAITGIYDNVYYYNGRPNMGGLVEVDGDYYFAKDGKGTLVTGKYYVWMGNGILPEGEYYFGEDGKLLDGIVEKDGNYYYYDMGKPKMAGLIEVDGAYYFVKDGEGTCIKDQVYYVWKGNGILKEAEYEFGPDGKMLDGLVEKDGNLCYYEKGRAQMAGLVEVDGDYYFAKDGKGTCIKDQLYYVWKGNGILKEGEYEFDADGKLIDGVVERDGEYYYYEMGRAQMAGLVEVDGDYYFAKDGKGTCVKNQKYYVWKGNGILPEGEYLFGEDGKMLDGFVTKDDGIYYYENGKPGKLGLFEYEGNYYFVKNGEGQIVVGQTYYAWETNGLSVEMNYTFDATGKIKL
ncbi:MAG: phosphodiester glycosidase family protein [Ruminococcus sp.]|nr:phosphodiester glycosidase family protein [Ruminococcus sp.]